MHSRCRRCLSSCLNALADGCREANNCFSKGKGAHTCTDRCSKLHNLPLVLPDIDSICGCCSCCICICGVPLSLHAQDAAEKRCAAFEKRAAALVGEKVQYDYLSALLTDLVWCIRPGIGVDGVHLAQLTSVICALCKSVCCSYAE